MFGLGMWEIAIIAIVALLVVGPDKLPDAAKKLSRGIRDFRQQTRDLSRNLEDDTDLGSAVRDLKSALRGDEIRSALYQPPHLTKAEAKPPEGADGEPLDDDHEAGEGDATADPPSAAEPSADAAINELAGDPDLPLLKTPADIVAKANALTSPDSSKEPKKASSEAEEVEKADKAKTTDEAHG